MQGRRLRRAAFDRIHRTMNIRLLSVLTCAALLRAAVAGGQPPPEADDWREVGGAYDRRALTPRAERALSVLPLRWRRAETEHFTLHFEQAIFARKVARMAEFFYRTIAADLRGPADRGAGRSHILIFHSPRTWAAFLAAMPDLPSWSASLVEGTAMFLQQADDTRSGGGRLAHEMTHLVMNRFFTGRPPLWLQEGLAEYYGEFAWSAFKGIKKSRRAAFPPLRNPYPLASLLAATAYPVEPAAVSAFYETSRYLVGFLLLDHPPDVFPSFLKDLHAQADAGESFARHYGYASPAELDKAFGKFAR